MGNGIGKVGHCFTGSGRATRHHRSEFYPPDPGGIVDDSLGHSFCYVRPDPARPDPPPASSSSIFRSISGASVSANTSTNPLSVDPAATANSSSGPLFESSTSFASAPLHPLPKSGPLIPGVGPVHDRCFLSGPIDRAGVGFLSGPLDRPGSAFSGPLDRASSRRRGPKKILRGGSHTLVRGLRRAISKTFGRSSFVAPVRGLGLGSDNWIIGSGVDQKITNMTDKMKKDTIFNNLMGLDDDVMVVDDDEMMGSGWVSENLQWAQGRAGEDRVHVVVSEDHGWVFVGIYDGFNGPDATDFLLSNLYSHVVKELKGLLWDECSKFDSFSSTSASSITSSLTNSGSIDSRSSSGSLCDIDGYVGSSLCCHESDGFFRYENGGEMIGQSRKGRKSRSKHGGVGKKWGENQRKWKCEWDRERLELDRRLKEQWSQNESKAKVINHTDVMKALAQALQKTEEAYLDIADRMLDENPELALMGSCVLLMLMKGEDVYVVNVGDSRAILAQTKEPDLRLGMIDQDLERINEESMFDSHVSDGVKPSLRSVQLTIDHSTSVDEEVQRIRGEHPDDAFSVVNDRVKGSLKVTRAFGAGFLKQPKWNDALLEMFRIDYVGTSPYISCLPSLCHHRLGPKDQFLLLSSDGLYQYFTNEEAVAEVELFISLSPEGDPAQHLVEEVLLRAAKKAGMDFYELLEIPQGDRRKYHDDVSIIIISFEGRIWRSCV